MVRPTDQETISTERTICYSQFPGGRGMPHHSGPRGEAPVCQESNELSLARGLFVVFMGRNRQSKADKLNRFRIG